MKDIVFLKDIMGFLEWFNEKNVVYGIEIIFFFLIDISYFCGVVMIYE